MLAYADVTDSMGRIVTLTCLGNVAGGYDMGFYPAGGEFEAANAPDWIDWKKIGW